MRGLAVSKGTDVAYRPLQLFIDGQWIDTGSRDSGAVLNPATGREIGRVPFAASADLDRALEAAARAFEPWRRTSAFVRGGILRAAATRLRERAESIAPMVTLEQGKPLAEALWEVTATADVFDWAAGEGQRAYGRIIPARSESLRQHVVKEPVGPAAGFSPWNAPALLFGRKVAEALAAGCSCIMKPAEETPASSLEVTRALADAGLPAGVLNIVFGVPAEISTRLIASPTIRKISFTGSVEVGRTLARLAGEHLKRITLELGGHAPVLIFGDAHIERVAELAVAAKFRNAGQVCTSPTRFLVHETVHDSFVRHFSERASAIRLGDGLEPETRMGPLNNVRRLSAMERIVADARAQGANVETGGRRVGDAGFLFEPTVLSRVSEHCEIMNREPFGPIIAVTPFARVEEAVHEANRLPYGLAAYAFTGSSTVAGQLADAFQTGLVGLNTFGVNFPETPFGGVKDSGYGSEGGAEGVSAYLVSKYIAEDTQRG
jgi:succinate-semialdehyde dehydrogenase/glutarate-semialdehyde dehydrogenase